MPFAKAKGAKLYYEETGSGTPIVFVHEFAGDVRSWEPQVRHFSRRYRCVTFNARGYAPSDVPERDDLYSQAIACDDIAAVMAHLKLKKAHIVGLSMGGFATVHFGIRYAKLASALVVAGCGYGAPKAERAKFQAEAAETAAGILRDGMAKKAETYGMGPTRVQLLNTDPRGHAEFLAQLKEHSTKGSAMTMRNVQAKRPSLYDLEDDLKKIRVPTLLVTGDEDEPCLDANVYMKRTIPSSALYVMPKTGHACNLEDPAAFNGALEEFFHTIECGRWTLRDPRSLSSSILGGSKPAAGKKKAA